jgi:thiol-disulfide isomerase/thioredoxin
MDRLHVVILTGVGVVAAGLCGGVGCGRERDARKEPAAGGRVDAVQAGAQKKVTADEFCDTRTAEGVAPDLALPALAGGKAAPAKGTWRWINVWATWCKPCIEEMPQLVKWHKELGAKGTPFDLVFVSVDDSDDVVTRFRERHPDAPDSVRFADPDALPKWLGAIGLGEQAPIPVHVFVDPDDKVRCVRAGGVKEKDLPAVRAIFGAT